MLKSTFIILFHFVFFRLLTVTFFEMLPKHIGYGLTSESFALIDTFLLH